MGYVLVAGAAGICRLGKDRGKGKRLQLQDIRSSYQGLLRVIHHDYRRIKSQERLTYGNPAFSYSSGSSVAMSTMSGPLSSVGGHSYATCSCARTYYLESLSFTGCKA